ncbi:putative defense protein 3 isoform X2 [Oscarella lobularis]|uniref:putative defense protein 3 isoform X2 n=1 Tax=Oscarella lobularis TaxID=121494 RepID=UPI0033138A62
MATKALLYLSTLLTLLSRGDAYSLGPPVPFVFGLCEGLAPNPIAHRADAQTSPSPYVVTTTAVDGYVPYQVYNVTISKANESTPDFRGFFCQVRQTNGSSGTVGSFVAFDTELAQTLPCTTEKGAVGHKSPVQKSSISVSWQAPGKGYGQLYATCSVVQSMMVYWVQIKSATFDELDGPSMLPTPTPGPTDEDIELQIREYFLKWKDGFENWERAYSQWEAEQCPQNGQA